MMTPSQSANLAGLIGQLELDQTEVPEKTYYSQLDGNTYICKNGHVCRFENGAYSTTKKGEQDELDALCKLSGRHQIATEPQEVRRTDAKVLKDVSNTQSNSGTGTMSTRDLGNLLKR